MNKVELVGNLTRDPEMRQTGNGTQVAHFTVAVTRNYKSADGSKHTDFISCVAWRKQAEFICNYFTKGMKIGVIGSIRTRSYEDKQGQRRSAFEVECDELEFVTSKAQNPQGGGGGYNAGSYTPPQQQPAPSAPQASASSAPPVPDYGFPDDGSSEDFVPMDEDELPF